MSEIFDLVRETSTTEGTSDITMDGANAGYQSFADACGGSAIVPYVIKSAMQWEVGIGTFTAPATLERTTVTASSNSGSLVDFDAGEKSVFIAATAWFMSRIAVGNGALPAISSGACLAIGDGAVASAANAIVVGPDSEASSSSSVAIGNYALAGSSYSYGAVAAGFNVTANSGVSIGANIDGGEFSVALGIWSSTLATGNSSVTIGHNAGASGQSSVALGYQASASAANAIAISSGGAQAAAASSIVIGSGRAEKAYSVAIGDSAYCGMAQYQHARGFRYGYLENTIWLKGVTNSGTSSVALTTPGADEIVNILERMFVVDGYVQADGADDYAIFKVRVAFQRGFTSGVWAVVGTATYEVVAASAGAATWGVAISYESGNIIRVTVNNASAGYQTWNAKLMVEGF